MGRLRRPFGNLSVIILKNKMGLRPILILQGFKILYCTIIYHESTNKMDATLATNLQERETTEF